MKLFASCALSPFRRKGRDFRIPKGDPSAMTTKTKIIMRINIAAFLILISCLNVFSKASAQKITLQYKQAELETVFKAIERQVDYGFAYGVALLANSQPISIDLKNVTLNQVLDHIFKDLPYRYEIVNKTILIKPKSQPAKPLSEKTPPIRIRGKVTDKNNTALPGVSVRLLGTSIGTVTDQNGNYQIDGDNEGILQFSYIGFQTIEIRINGQSEINMTLVDMNTQLDQVQILGYGSTTARLNTGNTFTVTAKEIEKQPVNNPLLALQGRVPGLTVTQSTGIAGSGVTVRIQGQNSILYGNDPFYVIDGIPYVSLLLPTYSAVTPLGNSGNSATIPAGAGNPFSFINPADIESITILKDADATAIYGSRAGNGAILITTKKGKAGKTKADVNFQQGFGQVGSRLKLMNTQQYLEMRREAKFNNNQAAILPTDYDINGTWDSNRYTDWQEELIGGTATYTDLQANVSGGNENTQFLFGSGYHRETTVFPGDLVDRKFSSRLNVNHTSTNRKFQANFSVSYLQDINKLFELDYTAMAMKLPPNAPALYNADGTLNWQPLTNGNSTWANPLAKLNNQYKITTGNLLGSALLSYRLFRDLELKTSFGYNDLRSSEILRFPLTSSLPENRPFIQRSTLFNDGVIQSWNIEPQINYVKEISQGKLDILIGGTIQQNKSKQANIFATGFNSDLVMEDIKAATSLTVQSSLQSTYKYNALFGRINYNYANKYILNLTARRDASSRFGRDNMVHNFGAVGASWIISDEAFVKRSLPFLSFAKLQSSYGLTGNDQIGDYQYLNLFTPFSTESPYQGATSLLPTGLANSHLQWESTRKWQSSLNLGFINDRILLQTTYFNNRSSNQLLPQSLPFSTGFDVIIRNFPATVQNSGLEFALNIEIIKNTGISWTSNVNLTIPKNKLVAFPNLASSSFANRLIIGKPINIGLYYNYIGTNQQTGLYEFADAAGHPTSAPNSLRDRLGVIDENPKYYGGFQNSLTYKGLSLDILIQFTKQVGRNYNFQAFGYPGQFFGTSNIGNQPIDLMDRWRKPGDVATYQQVTSTRPAGPSNAYIAANISTFAFTDGSYARLKNASLSWTLPARWTQKANLQSCRLYLQGQNLWTITKNKGLDPETKSSISLPPLRVITMGIQVTL